MRFPDRTKFPLATMAQGMDTLEEGDVIFHPGDLQSGSVLGPGAYVTVLDVGGDGSVVLSVMADKPTCLPMGRYSVEGPVLLSSEGYTMSFSLGWRVRRGVGVSMAHAYQRLLSMLEEVSCLQGDSSSVDAETLAIAEALAGSMIVNLADQDQFSRAALAFSNMLDVSVSAEARVALMRVFVSIAMIIARRDVQKQTASTSTSDAGPSKKARNLH